MKICFIKQYYDILGPRSSFLFKKKTITEILNLFNTKLNGFSNVMFAEGDYYIINSYNFKRHECEIIKNNTLEYNYKEIYIQTLGKTFNEEDIPYDNYDIVWCRDPILKNIKEWKKKYPKTLFVYEEVEYNRGFCPLTSKYYDLILRHEEVDIDLSLKFFHSLGISIPFPYPRMPDKIRPYFKNIKRNNRHLYIDYRDVYIYTINKYLAAKDPNYENNKKKIIEKFEIIKNNNKEYIIISNLQNSLNGLCISRKSKSDSEIYLKKLRLSKYFTSTSGRIGQSLVDAAELNCICFGTAKSPNHTLICHPFTLFNSFQSIENIFKKIRQIESNKKLEEEILMYQNERLYKYYVNYQKKILNKALKIKINNLYKNR